MNEEIVKLKLEYLRELRLMFEGNTFNADGKAFWVVRAQRVCESIERDLGISVEQEE